VVGVVANRVRGFELDAIAAPNADPPIYALPEVDLLMAPTVGQVAAACHGEVIAGDAELLGREALHLTVAAMTLPNLMERITDGAVLITPATEPRCCWRRCSPTRPRGCPRLPGSC
jgi:phosphate acetyltransferase